MEPDNVDDVRDEDPPAVPLEGNHRLSALSEMFSHHNWRSPHYGGHDPVREDEDPRP